MYRTWHFTWLDQTVPTNEIPVWWYDGFLHTEGTSELRNQTPPSSQWAAGGYNRYRAVHGDQKKLIPKFGIPRMFTKYPGNSENSLSHCLRPLYCTTVRQVPWAGWCAYVFSTDIYLQSYKFFMTQLQYLCCRMLTTLEISRDLGKGVDYLIWHFSYWWGWVVQYPSLGGCFTRGKCASAIIAGSTTVRAIITWFLAREIYDRGRSYRHTHGIRLEIGSPSI